MGSSPKLDFGWVRVPAHGFKSQSVVNSFTGDMSLIPGQATGSMGHSYLARVLSSMHATV